MNFAHFSLSIVIKKFFYRIFYTQKTKDSPWANSDGFFILIDRLTESRGCINARSFLWTAWKYDLLSVIFICIEPDGIFYYTHNPYSNSTPSDWSEVERVKGHGGHPYIIMKQKFAIHSKHLLIEYCCSSTTELFLIIILLSRRYKDCTVCTNVKIAKKNILHRILCNIL